MGLLNTDNKEKIPLSLLLFHTHIHTYAYTHPTHKWDGPNKRGRPEDIAITFRALLLNLLTEKPHFPWWRGLGGGRGEEIKMFSENLFPFEEYAKSS